MVLFINSIKTLESMLLFLRAKANWLMTDGSCSFLHFFRMFIMIEIRTTRETAIHQLIDKDQPLISEKKELIDHRREKRIFEFVQMATNAINN